MRACVPYVVGRPIISCGVIGSLRLRNLKRSYKDFRIYYNFASVQIHDMANKSPLYSIYIVTLVTYVDEVCSAVYDEAGSR